MWGLIQGLHEERARLQRTEDKTWSQLYADPALMTGEFGRLWRVYETAMAALALLRRGAGLDDVSEALPAGMERDINVANDPFFSSRAPSG